MTIDVETGKALRGWIERLANTRMDLSLADWSEFSALALSAADASERLGKAVALLEPLRRVCDLNKFTEVDDKFQFAGTDLWISEIRAARDFLTEIAGGGEGL